MALGKVRIVKKASKSKSKKKEAPLSPRDEKLISLVAKGGKSKAKILKEAGYSAAVQKNPKRVFGQPRIKKQVDKVLDDLKIVRQNVIDGLKSKDMKKQGVGNLGLLLKTLNHDIELFEGRPTDRTEEDLSPESKAHLDSILDMHKKK